MPSVRALQENIPNAFSVTGTLTAQLAGSAAAPIVATVGGQQYRSIQNLSLNLANTGAGGLDTGSVAANTLYYIHVVLSSGSLSLLASTSRSAPSGFSTFKYTGFALITSSTPAIQQISVPTALRTVTTLTSGPGTYTLKSGCVGLRVKMVGGGSGGRGSSGNNTAGASGAGGNTTFAGGSISLSANGAGAAASGIGGVGTGGGVSISGSVIDMGSTNGAHGQMGGPYTQSTAIGCAGGNGASSAFGGGGYGGNPNTNVSAGGNGSPGQSYGAGGGGGGQGSLNNSYPGGGGGAGGYVDVFIPNPPSSYSYSIGAGGAGSAGVGSLVGSGGAGVAGVIVIEEFYA